MPWAIRRPALYAILLCVFCSHATSAGAQAGPPPTPRHTGIKATFKELVSDVKNLPSIENAIWAGVGGGLALSVHPADDNVNQALVGNSTAEKIFKPGAILGQFPTLFSA